MYMYFSIAAILTMTGYAVFLLFRSRSVATWALSAALVAAAFLELFDSLSLTYPDGPFSWQRWSLAAAALLPGLWLLVSACYARQQGLSRLSRSKKLLLIFSPFFLVPVII